MIALLAISFTISCSKDDDKNLNSLEGTEWESSGSEVFYENGNQFTFSWVETINFLTSSTGTWRLIDTSGDYYWPITYTYSSPTITVKVDGETFIGTISKNQIIFYSSSRIYTKK